jgi:alpha-L-rhamnosidase
VAKGERALECAVNERQHTSRRQFVQRLGGAAAAACLAPAAIFADEKDQQPVAGSGRAASRSIKSTLSVDLTATFQQQMGLLEQRRDSWLQKAQRLTPELHKSVQEPLRLVSVVKNRAAFQGWKIVPAGDVASISARQLAAGDSIIVDFGEHGVGHFQFNVNIFDLPIDAPVRLSLIFAEMPAELGEPFDPYRGELSRSWLQDEVINIDTAPSEVRLPRRYAFRYVKITVIATGHGGKFGVANIRREISTSADPKRVAPFQAKDKDDAALEAVALRTLRDCMQSVFEDGPKRDRRLWLGDTRLQALANYASYRNFDLVKRCLYLLAGTASAKGLVATCMYDRPHPIRGQSEILDYTALFAPTVLEYLAATGDAETAEDLWPLVLKQVDFTLDQVSPEGLFVPKGNWWCFIDWNDRLDKQAAVHGTILFGLRATLSLAERIGKQVEAAFLKEAIPRMESAARTHFWDESLGLFVSGGKRQVSWASQAWMVLAGVPSESDGRRALAGVMKHPSAEKPVTPYCHHYMVEALFRAGLKHEAMDWLRSYWGGMIKKGADTFWEVYVPDDDLKSPYNSYLINSYCHAWSCTPSYFLRSLSESGHQPHH